MQTAAEFDRCSQKLAALAEPTRLHIAHRLMARGPACVTELARELGIAIPMASHHLRQLRVAGIVQSYQRGRIVTYSLRPGIATNGNKLDLGGCQITLTTNQIGLPQ